MTLNELLINKRYAPLMDQICSDSFDKVAFYAYLTIAEFTRQADIFPVDLPKKYMNYQVNAICLDYEDKLAEIQLDWGYEDMK